MIEFRIGNSYWQLGLVDKESLDDNLGITYFTDYKIILAIQSCRENMKSALKHEITHAFRWSYGLIISDQKKVSMTAAELEEVIANMVETFGEDIIQLCNELWPQIEEWLDKEESDEL